MAFAAVHRVGIQCEVVKFWLAAERGFTRQMDASKGIRTFGKNGPVCRKAGADDGRAEVNIRPQNALYTRCLQIR